MSCARSSDWRTGPLAEPFADADRNPPVYDPATKSVTMPEGFRKSYDALMDSEWWRLDLPEHLGGTGAPPSLRWAAAEMMLGSNPAAFMFMSGPGFAVDPRPPRQRRPEALGAS